MSGLKPKVSAKNEFIDGNIRIDQGVNMRKPDFIKFYTGKANVDVNDAWEKYKTWKLKYK